MGGCRGTVPPTRSLHGYHLHVKTQAKSELLVATSWIRGLSDQSDPRIGLSIRPQRFRLFFFMQTNKVLRCEATPSLADTLRASKYPLASCAVD